MNLYQGKFFGKTTAAQFISTSLATIFQNAPAELHKRMFDTLQGNEVTAESVNVLLCEFATHADVESRKRGLGELRGAVALWSSLPEEGREEAMQEHFRALNIQGFINRAEETRMEYQKAADDLTTLFVQLKTMRYDSVHVIQAYKDAMTRQFIKVARASDAMNAAMFVLGANDIDRPIAATEQAPSSTMH